MEIEEDYEIEDEFGYHDFLMDAKRISTVRFFRPDLPDGTFATYCQVSPWPQSIKGWFNPLPDTRIGDIVEVTSHADETQYAVISAIRRGGAHIVVDIDWSWFETFPDASRFAYLMRD